MNKGTKPEWFVTLVAFIVTAVVLFSVGYEDRAVVGGISFMVALILYSATVFYEKKKIRSSRNQ